MVNLLKYKHKLCRKYEDDIWGLILKKGKFNKTGELLANLKRKSKRISRTSGFKSILNDRKKICLFYGGLKVYELNRYCKLAKYEGTGAFSDDVASLLERRLCVIIYRMNFVSSIAQGMNYIKAGYFLVNKELIKSPNYFVQVGDVIEVNPKLRKDLWKEIYQNLNQKFIPISYPKYVEVNYQILAGILIAEPIMSEIYYPFSLESNFFYIAYHSRIR